MLIRGNAMPPREKKPPPEVNERDVEGGGPFVKFFLQRPIARQEFAQHTLPAARRAIEAERAVEVQQHFRDEVEAINERRVFLERIGLQPASPRSLALRERAARLAEPPSAAAPGDSSMIEDATKDVVASERVQSAELRRRLKYG